MTIRRVAVNVARFGNRGSGAPIVMTLGGRKTERAMRRYAAMTDSTRRAAAEAVSGAESFVRRPSS